MPYLSSTFFVVVLVLGVLVALTGYFLFARSLFPAFVSRSEQAWTERPISTMALGLPVSALLVALSVLLLNAPVGALRVFGFATMGLSLGFVFAGTAGLAARIGRGLLAPSDAEKPGLAMFRGGIVLELTMLFPILGWFLVAPLAIVGGAGAASLALLRRSARAVPAPHVVHSGYAPHAPMASLQGMAPFAPMAPPPSHPQGAPRVVAP